MKLTKRLPLYVGTRCNCACLFCYYLSEINQEHLPYEQIVNQLKIYKKHKIKSVDITGGEPTIHKDILKIVRTCIQMGFDDISLITNGIALKKESFIDELLEAGVTTFVLSLHGPSAEIHDSLTRKAGSFDTLIKTMRYLTSRCAKYSVNMVVNNRNYQYLEEFACLLSEIKAKGPVTFLVMNPLGDGKINFDNLAVNYSAAAVQIKKAIEIFKLNRIACTWKFMPLCVGREMIEHTNNVYQFYYDQYDWDYPTQFRINYGKEKYFNTLIKNFSQFNKYQLNAIPYKHLIHLAVLNECFHDLFIKIDCCHLCKYFYVCDGISRNYINLFGKEEFIPIEGEKIINPVNVLYKTRAPNLINRLANHSFSIFSKIAYAMAKK